MLIHIAFDFSTDMLRSEQNNSYLYVSIGYDTHNASQLS